VFTYSLGEVGSATCTASDIRVAREGTSFT
jgi:hypothetical protein